MNAVLFDDGAGVGLVDVDAVAVIGHQGAVLDGDVVEGTIDQYAVGRICHVVRDVESVAVECDVGCGYLHAGEIGERRGVVRSSDIVRALGIGAACADDRAVTAQCEGVGGVRHTRARGGERRDEALPHVPVGEVLRHHQIRLVLIQRLYFGCRQGIIVYPHILRASIPTPSRILFVFTYKNVVSNLCENPGSSGAVRSPVYV